MTLPAAGAVRPGNLVAGFLFRSSMWGVGDQALVSASNLAVGLLLARALGPAGYGTFALAYLVLAFAGALQGALITTPHNVLGARHTGHAYCQYTTATGLAQIAYSVLAAILLAIIGATLTATGAAAGTVFLVLAPTCLAFQLQEFVRRVLYTQHGYRDAVLNDVVAYGGRAAIIVLLAHQDRLGTISALVTIGATAAAGAILGLWQLRAAFARSWCREKIREDLSANWQFGKWLLGSTLSEWMSGQMYPVLTAGFVGVAATGGLKGAQNLVAPTHVFLKSMENMLPARASRAFAASGLGGMRHTTRRFTLPTGILMAGYCLAISVLARFLMGPVLGADYRPYWWLVPVMAIVYMLAFGSTSASIQLSSVGKTAPMFYANVLSSVLALTLGVWIVRTWGLTGAAVGLIVHPVLLNVVLRHFLRQELRRR